MSKPIRRHTQRRARSFHSTHDSYNSSASPADEMMSSVLPLSSGCSRAIDHDHENLPSNASSSFGIQMSPFTRDLTLKRHTLSPRLQPSPVELPTNEHTLPLATSEHTRRKRAKSFTERDRSDSETRRGAAWDPEEEAKLRLRRTGEPESWEETGKYFPGRTTNALQKKWKLMTLSDKMKIEPSFEHQLISAVAKHAPGFYEKLALELNMSSMTKDDLENIADKVSILYIRGKLPLKSSSSLLMPINEDISSPISHKVRPASAPIPIMYTIGHYGRPHDGPDFQGTLSFLPFQESHSTTELSQSPDVYSSDTEDNMPYQLDGNEITESSLMSPFDQWNVFHHFPSSFIIDKPLLLYSGDGEQ